MVSPSIPFAVAASTNARAVSITNVKSRCGVRFPNWISFAPLNGNEVPHQERIGDIAEPHLQPDTQVLRYVPQVSDIAATVVPRQRADLMTFAQQQFGYMAANKPPVQ
jgi:hypothetical protein